MVAGKVIGMAHDEHVGAGIRHADHCMGRRKFFLLITRSAGHLASPFSRAAGNSRTTETSGGPPSLDVGLDPTGRWLRASRKLGSICCGRRRSCSLTGIPNVLFSSALGRAPNLVRPAVACGHFSGRMGVRAGMKRNGPITATPGPRFRTGCARTSYTAAEQGWAHRPSSGLRSWSTSTHG